MTSTPRARTDIEVKPVARPYPERTRPLPWRREDVTAAWLTELLQHKYPGVVAEHLEQVEFIDSHTAKIRMAVVWNAAGQTAGLPQGLCLKSNFLRDYNDVDICAVEARFYHFLSDKVKAPTPRCYYADWEDDGSAQGLILLEDLTERGGRFGQSADHAGLDSVATAVAGLAQLHGSLWDSPLISPAHSPWLQTSMRTPVDSDQVRIMWRFIEMNLEDPEFRAIAPQHFLDEPRRVEWAFDRLGDFERACEGPFCLLLGDSHQGNTYILPDGERLWLDWQLVRRGRPWRDLTYVMVGTLTIEERRQHERDLLALYRQKLIDTGATGVIGLDEIWEQHRRWIMLAVQAWVAALDRWGHTRLPIIERCFVAAEDLGTWKLLLGE